MGRATLKSMCQTGCDAGQSISPRRLSWRIRSSVCSINLYRRRAFRWTDVRDLVRIVQVCEPLLMIQHQSGQREEPQKKQKVEAR